MTSLIDVIFLLLLFFMLTSTFSKYAEVELLGAGAGAAVTSDQPPLFLRLGPDTLSLNSKAQTLDDLMRVIDTDRNASVLISLEEAVTSQRLVDLLAILGRIDGLQAQVLGGK